MGQSSQTQGIPKTHRNSRENKKENPRCATHNNKTLLKMPPGRVFTLT